MLAGPQNDASFFEGGKSDPSKHVVFLVHPGKLTCPLKRDYFNRKYIFQPSFFRGYVSFQGVAAWIGVGWYLERGLSRHKIRPLEGLLDPRRRRGEVHGDRWKTPFPVTKKGQQTSDEYDIKFVTL